MGLMDKVKAQASSLAQQANQGMAKLDNLPAQRRADALLRSLGVAVLAERTGRASGDTEAQISQILADIAQHEQQYNVDLVLQAAQAPPPPPWQSQQGQMQGPGEFLTGAPPVDPNVPAPPPPYAGAPGYGGQPEYQQPGGFPQQPPGFPQQGFPQPDPTAFPQQGGPTGSAPSTSFPEANPVGSADSADEPGQSSFFPPASGV
jgi:hypothetical protein